MREQISTLYDRVSALQNAVLEKQQQAAELAERCRELEDELGRVKGWETEKARYIILNIDDLAFVYGLNPERTLAVVGEVPHWLCANCFEDGKKSHLQAGKLTGVNGSQRNWKCPRCDTSIVVRSGTKPGWHY